MLARIKIAFQDHKIDALKEHTVWLGAGGSAVSFGERGAVATLMKMQDGIDWLIPVHCVSHQL